MRITKVSQEKTETELSDNERARGFVRPLRNTNKHPECGGITLMSDKIAENMAKKPNHYDEMYCIDCKTSAPLDKFIWHGTDIKLGE